METETIQKGAILISRPMIGDLIFNRSVVLITNHNMRGSIGFMVNKPTGSMLCEYISDLHSEFPVYDGGPVEQESIYFLHRRPDIIQDGHQIYPGLYWSGNYDDVRYAMKSGEISSKEIRFYLGYSGWGPKQIEQELEQNAWTLMKDRINIFENLSTNIWQQKMRQLGGENLLWVNTPEDPSLN